MAGQILFIETGFIDGEANAVNVKAFGFVGNIIYRLLI